MIVVGGVWLMQVRRWWWQGAGLRCCELVVVAGGISVWGMACAHTQVQVGALIAVLSVETACASPRRFLRHPHWWVWNMMSPRNTHHGGGVAPTRSWVTSDERCRAACFNSATPDYTPRRQRGSMLFPTLRPRTTLGDAVYKLLARGTTSPPVWPFSTCAALVTLMSLHRHAASGGDHQTARRKVCTFIHHL